MVDMHYTAGIATLLCLDFLWLRFYMTGRYETLIDRVQGTPMTPDMGSAIVAYLFMVYGLCHFVLAPLHTAELASCDDVAGRVWAAICQGGPFGIVVYGVYNATNSAVLRDWDMSIAVVDTMWGGFVYAASAVSALMFSCLAG
jgi:uncharacterized membrane protein